MSRVLVIDDDPMVTRLLTDYLSNEGHQVASAHMAEEGYEEAVRTSPELILLDVMLPDATGYQMLGKFRKNPITRTTPIIMMTGTARYQNQQNIGRSMGADEYMLKPFNVVEVGDKVNRLIANHRNIEQRDFLKDKPVAEHQAREILARRQPEEPAVRSEPEDAAVDMLVAAPAAAPVAEPVAEPDVAPVATPAVTTVAAPVIEPDAQPVAELPADFPEPRAPSAFVPELEAPIPVSLAPLEIINPDAEPDIANLSRFRWAFPLSFCRLTAAMFAAHLLISGIASEPSIGVCQTLTLVAAGWALLLGLVAAVCAVLGITLDARENLRLLGWASVPIVARALGSLIGWIGRPETIPASIYYFRPLDVFEMAAAVILGISLLRLRGGSVAKSIVAVIAIALAWSLAGRGYFQPF